jgi:hypothetical protein
MNDNNTILACSWSQFSTPMVSRCEAQKLKWYQRDARKCSGLNLAAETQADSSGLPHATSGFSVGSICWPMWKRRSFLYVISIRYADANEEHIFFRRYP